MAIKLLIAMLLLALTVSGQTLGQKDSVKSEVRVRGRGTRLVLTGRKVRRTLDVSEHVDAAKLDDVTLVFANRKEAFIYLLVDACGSSKLVSDARQCGAGTECNLLWLRLDHSWRLKEARSVRYESCWQPTTSTDGYKTSGDTLSLEYDNFSDKKSYKLLYDSQRPEAGFNIESSELTDPY